jgi:hypothetical protein
MPIVEKSSFKRAVGNITKWGDTDVFPFPIDNHILHDHTDAVIELLIDRCNNFDQSLISQPIYTYSTLAPVGYTGFRWATQIDASWNAYLLGLVLSVAPEIEKARLPESSGHVFSYRYQDNDQDGLFLQSAWRSFQDRTRLLAEEHQYVVSVDIADFYSRIYHHRLENALRPTDIGSNRTRQIMKILGILSGNTSYGLPVGGPAARILAELVLNNVDRLLLNEPATRHFCRYADDYRLFVDDIQSAYQAIGFLSEKLLRNEGLSLQKSKTRIMTSHEYLSMLDPAQPPPGSAAKFLGLHVHYDPYSATPIEDYERLKTQLEEFDVRGLLQSEIAKGRVHTALTRRLISALAYMDASPRKQAVLSLLENLETLAPVMPQVMLSIRSAVQDLADTEFSATVSQKIRSLIEEPSYISRIDLNLAYMIRVLATDYSFENEQILAALYQQSHGFTNAQSVIIQRDIMMILSNWRARYWLSDLKHNFSNMHPWLKRSFLMASYTLGDEGKHWRDSIKSTLIGYDKIVHDWAGSKTQIPDWRLPV